MSQTVKYTIEAVTQRVTGKDASGAPTLTELVDFAPIIDPKNPSSFQVGQGKFSITITDPAIQKQLSAGMNVTLTIAEDYGAPLSVVPPIAQPPPLSPL